MLLDLFKKKNKREKAIVFVDYEHWYYSYNNIFNMKPNLEEWYNEINTEYQIDKLMVFADFSERTIGNEISKLEGITNNIIHTTSSKEGVDKDFTDFIMLDYMYQAANEPNSPEVVILFTGDGHFDSVVRYLRSKMNKRVIIYGVKKAFSGKLKSIASSYVEMPRYVQQQQYYTNLIFGSLAYLDSKPDKRATYWKTIRSVSEYNGLPEDKIQTALNDLIDKQYIMEDIILNEQTQVKIRFLKVNWDKVEHDSIWNKNIA